MFIRRSIALEEAESAEVAGEKRAASEREKGGDGERGHAGL